MKKLTRVIKQIARILGHLMEAILEGSSPGATTAAILLCLEPDN